MALWSTLASAPLPQCPSLVLRVTWENACGARGRGRIARCLVVAVHKTGPSRVGASSIFMIVGLVVSSLLFAVVRCHRDPCAGYRCYHEETGMHSSREMVISLLSCCKRCHHLVVHCRNQNGNGQALTQEYCANPPVNAQACNPDPCGDFYWLPSPWPACSKVCTRQYVHLAVALACGEVSVYSSFQPCNGGLRSRRVICYDNVLRAPAASNRLCKDQPPPAEEQCNTLVCMVVACSPSFFLLNSTSALLHVAM